MLVLPGISLLAGAAESYLTLYANVMNYGTVLMLTNSSGVLTLYEIPASISTVPNFRGIQTTGQPLSAVTNVTLKSGQVALVHTYSASGFSTQNFVYDQVNVPVIQVSSNKTTVWNSQTTLYVQPNQGYEVSFTPWFAGPIWTVNTVESTSWKVLPYWQNGQLVVNSTGASTGGQYIAWKYSPVSNTINVTIKVTSFPQRDGYPGIVIYSSNIGSRPTDIDTGFYGLHVTIFNNRIAVALPSSGWQTIYNSLPQPNPNYPFIFSVILTKNSAGNVTVQSVYINGTAYTINLNTPYPWNQIGYVGIRGGLNNLFYVSYFAVSPGPYGGSFVFVNNVETTLWKTSPYWQNGQLVINSTGVGAPYGQYIAWRYSPISDAINVTIKVPSYPISTPYAGIELLSANPNLASDNNGGNYYSLRVQFRSGAWEYIAPWTGRNIGVPSSAIPKVNAPFTETIIFTKSPQGNVTISAIYVNGTLYSQPNIVTPFPWNQIYWIGIRGDSGNLFYVSYFSIASYAYGSVSYTINGYTLPSIPDTQSLTALIAQTTNGSYALLGYYTGTTWKELNAPISNPNGKISISFNPVGPVNVTVKSSNVVSYGAVFQPGSGVILETQNALPSRNPTVYAPLAYVGTNGQVGGGLDYDNPQFTPVNNGQINAYVGATIASTDWGSTNFTYYSASPNQKINLQMNYVVVGTGFTTGWSYTPGGYYSFNNQIDMAYVLNGSVQLPGSPPSVSSLIFFFDPTYMNFQGQYINPFTNKTVQLSGQLNRLIHDLGIYVFSDPNATTPVVYIPPFTEVVFKNATTTLTYVNYNTFPYMTVKVAPGTYQVTIILVYTSYSFVLIGFQGWNVTVFDNGQPIIVNDPITNTIQPFSTHGLVSGQIVLDPNKKVATIFLQPLSAGVGEFVPSFQQLPKINTNPVLVNPNPIPNTPFQLSTLTTAGIITVAMVMSIFIAMARSERTFLGGLAAGSALVAMVGLLTGLLPVLFLGLMVIIIVTAYRFARKMSNE
jgi:hypothetical protein